MWEFIADQASESVGPAPACCIGGRGSGWWAWLPPNLIVWTLVIVVQAISHQRIGATRVYRRPVRSPLRPSSADSISSIAAISLASCSEDIVALSLSSAVHMPSIILDFPCGSVEADPRRRSGRGTRN